jgi:hypothetical protein
MADTKGNGGKPDYKARQARKNTMGYVKGFIFVVLLGVVVGLGIVYKDQLMAMLNKKPETPPPAPPAAKPVDVAPKVADKAPEAKPQTEKSGAPVEKPKQITEVPQAAAGVEDIAAKALIEQGLKTLESLDFDKATDLFKQAGQKKVGTTVKNEALSLEKRARSFGTATRHIPISDYAIAENSCVLEMVSGSELQGLIKSQDDQLVLLQQVSSANPATLGKTTLPIPKSEIKNMRMVTLQQRREEFVQLLGSVESNTTITRSTDYYDLVYVSKRLGLGKECITYLTRAYNGGPGHDADPYLGDSFRKEVIRRTIDRCSLMLASGQAKYRVETELNDLVKKKLPGYDVAMDEVEAFRIQVLNKVKDDFKSTLRKTEVASSKAVKKEEKVAEARKAAKKITDEGEQMEFVVENGGVKGNGSAGPIVEQANSKYEEGMKTYRSFRLGTNGNNNQILKDAMKLLVDAVNMYDEALKKDPTNKSVLDRQTEANMIVYACKKYQTL